MHGCRDDVDRSLLSQPLTVNRRLTLRNRIVMAPMTRNFSPNGVPGQDVSDYYRRRAAGGVGLIVTEGVGVDHPAAIGDAGLAESAVPDLHGQASLAGWQRITDAIHDAGGIVFPQLWHQGVMRVAGTGRHPEARSMRPSGLWGPADRRSSSSRAYVDRVVAPTERMSDADIADVIAAFARSAANAKMLGMDGIAIHGAHGYLFDTFFWSETNRREDRWSGGIAERARFAVEVVRAIRDTVGADMPIMFRYSQWKLQDLDARLAETPGELELLLSPLIDAGVDIFDASTRIFDQPAFVGSDRTLAGWTRKITGKITMAVGGIGIGQDMFSRLAGGSMVADNVPRVLEYMHKGEFDLVGVGRALMADPDWTQRALNGEPFKPYTQAARDVLF